MKISILNKGLLQWLIASLLMFTPLYSKAQNDEDTLENLNNKIQQLAEKEQLPSIAYSILQNGRTVHKKAFGMADLKTQTPAITETLYRIGSVTKTVTALGIMKLVEQGRLDLSDEIRTLIPDVGFSNPWKDLHPIRVKHLLNHTTGWDGLALKEFARVNSADETLSQKLAFYPESRASRWPPGTRYSYSNSNAAVAGSIIEKITEMPFSEAIDKLVLSPLSMNDASFEHEVHRHASGSRSGQPIAYKELLYSPAGGLNASLNDMNKLLGLFLGNSAFLSDKNLEKIREGAVDRDEPSYGLFSTIKKISSHEFFGHDGATNDSVAALQYSPSLDAGFVIMTNTPNQRALTKAANYIADYLTQGKETSITPATEKLSPAQKSLSGSYYVINPRFEKVHFLNRLLATFRVNVASPTELRIRGLFTPWNERFVTTENGTLVSKNGGQVKLMPYIDPVGESVLLYGTKALEPTSTAAIYSQIGMMSVWLVMVIVMTIIFIIALIRRYFSTRMQALSNLWALSNHMAMASALLCIVMLLWGVGAADSRLSTLTLQSGGAWLFSILFGIFTVSSVILTYKGFKQLQGRINKSLYSIACALNIFAFLYLLTFGVIGIQTWT